MATTTVTTTAVPVKHQVVDRLPKKFKQIKFGIQSNQDIVNQAVIEVSDRTMYDIDRGREPTSNGILDKRLVSLHNSSFVINFRPCANILISREFQARLALVRLVACDYKTASVTGATFDYRCLPSMSATSNSPLRFYRIYARTVRESY